MKTNKALKGDIVEVRGNYHDQSGTRSLFMTLRVSANREQLKSRFGEDFAEQIFSSMHSNEDEEGVRWGFLEYKPKAVFEVHSCKVGDQDAAPSQPEMLKVKPVDGQDVVNVYLRFPFVGESAAFAGYIWSQLGNSTTVKMTEQSPQLPGTE